MMKKLKMNFFGDFRRNCRNDDNIKDKSYGSTFATKKYDQ